MNMLNQLLSGAVAAILLAVTFAAEAQDTGRESALAFDRNAKAVLETFSPIRKTVRPTKSGGFSRIDWTLVEPALVDVKRTDSLVEPFQAVIDMKTKMAVTLSAPTEAEAATADAKPMDEFRIQATFVPAGKGWTFKGGRYESKSLNRWFEIKPDALRAAQVSPFAELLKHFEVL